MENPRTPEPWQESRWRGAEVALKLAASRRMGG